jgi:hypothetical protein
VNGIENVVRNAYRFCPAPAVPPAPWYTSRSFSRSPGGDASSSPIGSAAAAAGIDHAHVEARSQTGTVSCRAGVRPSTYARAASPVVRSSAPAMTPATASESQCTPR